MAVVRQRTAQGSNATEIEKKIKRGNALRQGSAWRWSRGSVALLLGTLSLCGAAVWLYVTSLDSEVTETLVSRSELVSPQPRVYAIECSEDYENYKRYPGCTPQKCGRAVTDSVVTREEAQALRRNVRERIQAVIAETFDLDPAMVYLTKPTFFSRINSTAAKTQHDEYWHPHIDKVIHKNRTVTPSTLDKMKRSGTFSAPNHAKLKVTYGSFDYTSLLYLSDYGSDFTGGRFIFMDQNGNRTVEPRAGRVSFFTSGSENLHRVERVTWGTRYAITVSFTCDPAHAISDPALP
ncbi:2-oxoglutarate and iron-dependent oxygenase domain-containing protein 3 [Collichthys lucidus]|uniref:2-oxoglutarate and iron-dependent oxygenase domain-containing protein 3 n=1 Tax=Collichthys lucidus TaxID=240159 RepID=A0A4U5VNV4_COLLU|nr:2-oxoglutarate and iron-dependent oxygenase domain-containing protein 3 [Collichthys lucidus]